MRAPPRSARLLAARTAPPREGAGFTLLEVVVAVALLAIVVIKAAMILDMANERHDVDTTEMALEAQAHRVLDRIAYAIVGTSRERLLPDPQAPICSGELRYEVSIGVEDGAVVWGDPERIGIGTEERQVVWEQAPPLGESVRRVWCSVARPLLEGELANGRDDNGNGLVDERGLSFTLDGDVVTIRLTLERQTRHGLTTRTVETTVTLRN
jgi:prepilin-type N-terminal cleavage/methylation domain-containing protein